MKLLTWMHRKFKQGSSEILREFPIGQTLLDDPNFYQKQNHDNDTWRQMHRGSFSNHETPKLTDLEERASVEFSDLFEGFLTIGTLGTEAGGFTEEPETPNFDVSFKRLAEEEHQVTENELRIINDELEKVLAAEAKDDCWTDSSSRNSRVSNGRISHASTITLSGKPLEIPETTTGGYGNLNCPLQEYLLGSAVELPEKAVVPKKENRTSLGELFEKHKAEETISVTKPKKGEKREDKETEKTATNLMKKIPKKKMASASSKNSSGAARGTTDSTTAETKLFKILHKFHRKVHPEYLITGTEKPDKSHKMRFKDMIPCNAGYYKNKHTFPDEDISNLSQKARGTRANNSHTSSSEFNVDRSTSNGSRECWIKTDADYLVLEL